MLGSSSSCVRGRVLPEQDGTIGTHTHDVLFLRADLESGDVATMAHSNVGHRPLVVVPHFHQVVVTTCIGHKGRTEDYTEPCCAAFCSRLTGREYLGTL